MGVFGLVFGIEFGLFEAGVRGVWKVEGNKSEGCESVLVEGVGGEATVVTKGVKFSSFASRRHLVDRHVLAVGGAGKAGEYSRASSRVVARRVALVIRATQGGERKTEFSMRVAVYARREMSDSAEESRRTVAFARVKSRSLPRDLTRDAESCEDRPSRADLICARSVRVTWRLTYERGESRPSAGVASCSAQA